MGTKAPRRHLRLAGALVLQRDERLTPMRLILSALMIFAATGAAAHPGHWGELAGHDHWVAGAAIGLAGLAAIWGALKGKKAKEEEAEPEEELEEEAA